MTEREQTTPAAGQANGGAYDKERGKYNTAGQKTGNATERLDIDELKSRISMVDLAAACGVEMKKSGNEYKGLCPFHSEKTPSFTVTPHKSDGYYCFGCGAKGDHLNFVADLYGIDIDTDFPGVLNKLQEIVGTGTTTGTKRAKSQPKPRPELTEPWQPMGAGPEVDPPATLSINRDGKWVDAPVVASWAYRDTEGGLHGFTCRVEPEPGKKEIIPVTWMANTETGATDLRRKSLPEPRLLYGAELLKANPKANVILTEGEKAADAARRMLKGKPFIVLSWPGGGKAVSKADWSLLAGRKIVGWPDCDSKRDRQTDEYLPYCDQPGMSAMLAIAAKVADHGATMRIVRVPEPGQIDDGWDAADAEADGWDAARVIKHIKDNACKPEDLISDREAKTEYSSVEVAEIEPRMFSEILNDARQLTNESDAESIDALVQEAVFLPVIQKRQVRQAIKKGTGLPFSVMEEAERSQSDEGEADDLQLARSLVQEVGPENVLAADTFVWQWRDRGVWQKQEDRTVKQWVQRHLADNADGVRKSLVDSVADLFRTEVFKPHHLFDVGPPECVNTLNGELVLNGEQWELMPHNREHYRTTQIPVEYDPKAQAPRFLQFMSEVFKGDPDAGDKATALLEMIGYTLMAHCRHEKFIILVGSGANGKSVFLAILEALAGPENVAGVQPSQFDRSFQRAHLHGKLANIVTEIKQGEMIDDASLKGIVSGEPTTVEHKFKDPFVMRPFSTCWFGTNHMPHTRDFSDALFRRALVVEFNNKFKPELGNCDPQLKEKLMEEMPGILSLALDAYADARQIGFTMPESCQQARDQWRLEADQVAQFVEAECVTDPEGRVKPQNLFDAYVNWAQDNGIHKRLTQKSFGDRLVMLGFERKKSDGTRYISGLKCQRAVIG